MDVESIFYSAENGDLESQLALAFLHFGNKNSEQNWSKSFYYFELAANNGSEAAKFFLANLYLFGKGVAKSKQSAFLYMEMAAKSGYMPAKLTLVNYIENGIGVDKDINKAKSMLYELARSNCSGAANKLAIRLSEGFYGNQSVLEAKHWWHTAINQGSTSACYHLATVLEDENNLDEAFKFFEMGAKRGDYGCCIKLALKYSKGIFGEVNIEKSNKYEKLAEACKVSDQYRYLLDPLLGNALFDHRDTAR